MTKRLPSNLQVKESIPYKSFPILISGCLVGICCRYDGGESSSPEVIDITSSASIIPFCPEQLGGLPTPRPPANIVGGDGKDVLSGKARVINSMEEDVTEAYRKGAEESLRLARLTGAGIALLKDRSPSCGIITPYCDKSGESGMGVTAALLSASGIQLLEINKVDEFPASEFNRLLERVYGKSST